MLVSVQDRMEVMDRRKTADGFLATKGRIAKTGIYKYGRGELNLDGNPNEMVSIYRPEDAVFSDESMASAAHRPLTLNHPPVFVDSSNWKKYGVGHAGAKVKRDGEHVEVDMLVMDGPAISAVEGGAEISPGYTANISMVSGQTPEGEHYDGLMEGPYAFNHIAILTGKGRGGASCRLGDAWPIEVQDNTPPKKEAKVKTFTLDGLPIRFDDEAAIEAGFAKLQDNAAKATTRAETAEKALADAAMAHTAALADAQKEHDKAMGVKDAAIADLEGKVMDQAQIDVLAQAKADIVTTAKAALGDKAPDFAGKSVADVRRLSVAAKFGDAAVADKSDDYVEARFDAMIASVDTNITDALRQSHANPIDVKNLGDAAAGARTARQEMIDAMANPATAEAK